LTTANANEPSASAMPARALLPRDFLNSDNNDATSLLMAMLMNAIAGPAPET